MLKNLLQKLNPFRLPSAEEVNAKELRAVEVQAADARRELARIRWEMFRLEQAQVKWQYTFDSCNNKLMVETK